jgi:hypothetical protein
MVKILKLHSSTALRGKKVGDGFENLERVVMGKTA